MYDPIINIFKKKIGIEENIEKFLREFDYNLSFDQKQKPEVIGNFI